MSTIKQHKRSYAGYLGSASGPENEVAPAITGTAQVGQTLTASPGTWAGRPAPTLAFKWYSGNTEIVGATSQTYVPQAGDVGKAIIFTALAHNDSGNASANSEPTAPVIAA